MNLTNRGFTLLELLTSISMIALIMGAMTAAIAGAQERAKIQKATAEVKAVTQAVLGYENYAGTLDSHLMKDREIDRSSIGFLLGDSEKSQYNTDIPVLLMAALSGSGKMVDPWGTPYRITIRKGKVVLSPGTATGSMSTSYVLPNFYRLSLRERNAGRSSE